MKIKKNQPKVLVYVDFFDTLNSNYYWLEAFSKVIATVIPIDIFKDLKGKTEKEISEIILNKKPCMVHFGGSVKKNDILPIAIYRDLKLKNPNIRLTAHYGDVYYSGYNNARSEYLSAFHTSNYCNVVDANSYYSPCCILERWIKPREKAKYDVVFIGNNYSSERSDALKKIGIYSKLHDWKLFVFGNGWKKLEEYNINVNPSVTVEESIDIYRRSKVVLGDFSSDYCRRSSIDKRCICGQTNYYDGLLCKNKLCPDFAPNIGWFSNRLINILASGATLITAYKTGMELVFRQGLHLFWYLDIENGIKLISNCLNKYNESLVSSQCEIIQNKAMEFTYEKAVNKLINFEGI
jgi:hypothetical protein